MPLYEYRCQVCGKTFEVMQKFSDTPLKIHENCGGELEKLLSAAAIQFKGTGWYITDYARGKSSSSDRGSNHKSADSETKSETKTETKKETKAETKTDSKPAAANRNS